MNTRRFCLLFAFLVILLPQLAHAHFLWLIPAAGEDAANQVHLYFGELAMADDPALLDNVMAAMVWQLDAAGKKVDLKTSTGEESIIVESVINGVPTAVAASHNWGVLQRGDTAFVLQYYAKTYHNAEPSDWGSIDSAKSLKFDITPARIDNKQIELTVKWDGNPLADAEVKVEDHNGAVEVEGKTDADGKFVFEAPADHTYSIRAKHVVDQAGEIDGKSYSDIRNYSTLAIRL